LSSRALAKMKSPPEDETGYMKNLAKKVLQNVEIVFENVVLKYVEDDLVLSLNIRKVVSQCVDSNWKPAFIG
jgi:vacuolar protein sorting-associated protein 13B